VPLQMAGTGPAMTVKAGFIHGGSADGRCELAMTLRGGEDFPCVHLIGPSVVRETWTPCQ
jgi:hypothetical protein